jgi:isoquinoline 1-oxidoreductase beta subunit
MASTTIEVNGSTHSVDVDGDTPSIPMLIAEELEVDLKRVRLEHAPPNEKLYGNPLLGIQATGNSNAIRAAWQPCATRNVRAGQPVLAIAAAGQAVAVVQRAGRFPEKPHGRDEG